VRSSASRIDSFITQVDEIDPHLNNGESIYVFACLLKGLIDAAAPDVADILRREVVFAINGAPNDLADYCGVPGTKQGGISA
jgi:hypothetical protein